MALQLYWFLPSHGDGRNLVARPGGAGGVGDRRRVCDPNYLAQVAEAADGQGFHGALLPFGLFCEDPWLIGAAVAARTERLRFMVAVRPGLMSPTLVAQMSATFQRITGDRLELNVVTGGDPEEQHRYGDWLDHAARYARTSEFLEILRSSWAGPTDLDGVHYTVAGARVMRPPRSVPKIFVGGSSDAAVRVACRHADVYLCWAEPPAGIAEQFTRVRAHAAGAGTAAPACGTRLHVISRDRAEDAWAVAEALSADLEPDTVRAARRRMEASDSVGQSRMAALHDEHRERGPEVAPNLWNGIGLVRQGPGLTLVGSHAEVAERIAELHDVGVEYLILSGQPHLEEAYWVGEGVIPLLRERGVLAGYGDGPGAPPHSGHLAGAVPGAAR